MPKGGVQPSPHPCTKLTVTEYPALQGEGIKRYTCHAHMHENPDGLGKNGSVACGCCLRRRAHRGSREGCAAGFSGNQLHVPQFVPSASCSAKEIGSHGSSILSPTCVALNLNTYPDHQIFLVLTHSRRPQLQKKKSAQPHCWMDCFPPTGTVNCSFEGGTAHFSIRWDRRLASAMSKNCGWAVTNRTFCTRKALGYNWIKNRQRWPWQT